MRDPLHYWVPAHEETYGNLAAGVAAQLGMPMDDEQRMILDAIYAEDEPGVPTCFEVGVVAPRQNLKTATLEIAALTDAFVLGVPLHVWTAHLFPTARKSFEHMVALIASSEDFRGRCEWPPRASHGEESIQLLTGEKIEFHARSTGGGRGFAGVSKVTFDEALFLGAASMGALLPTLATRVDAQVRYGSSAGLANSGALREIRDRGRRGGDPRLAYFEWGTPRADCAQGEQCSHQHGVAEGCALDREDLWAEANPALGRRIPLHTMRSFRRAMPPEEFAREFLSWWDEPAGEVERPIRPEVWARAATADAAALTRVAFGVTVAADRSRTTIGVAGLRTDGRVQVEVVADGRGVDWAPLWLAERVGRWDPVAVVLDGTALPLQPSLAALDVLAQPTTTSERSQASVAFFDALGAGGLCHPDEPLLNTAALTATRRPLTSGWVWEGSAVGALQAVTLARWGLVTAEVPRTPQPPLLIRSDRQGLSETADLATAHF